MRREVDYNQAVILSGGGAYAAYEVGALKALVTGESPATAHTFLNPGVLTGTSAGAVNASILASHPDADICELARRLESIWLDCIAAGDDRCGNGVYRYRGNLLRLADTQCYIPNPARPFFELAQDGAVFARSLFQRGLLFLVNSGSIENRALQLFDLTTFITNEPMESLLRRTVSLENIRRSERKLRVVATNWATGEVRTFANHEMTDQWGYQIIEGSAAIPGVFPPHYVEGDPYVDGGVLMNTPLNCAIDAGAAELHVIYMDPDVENIPLQRLQSVIDVLDRILIITSATKTNEDIDTARWINEGLGVVERAARGGGGDISDAELRDFIRVAGQLEKRLRAGTPYRKLTIHRYHPHDDLGGGALGLLNFGRNRIAALIERGFQDAMNHDCRASHCVLP